MGQPEQWDLVLRAKCVFGEDRMPMKLRSDRLASMQGLQVTETRTHRTLGNQALGTGLGMPPGSLSKDE